MSPQPLLGPSALATKCGGVPRPVDCSSLLFALKGQGDGQGAGRGAPQGGETERGQREQDGAPDRPQVRRGGREETRQKPGGAGNERQPGSQAARQTEAERGKRRWQWGGGERRRDESETQRGPNDQAWKVDGVRAQNPLAQGPGQRDQRSQVWGAPGTVLSSPGASPPPRNSRYAPGSCRSPGAGLDPADRGQSLSWGPASQWER